MAGVCGHGGRRHLLSVHGTAPARRRRHHDLFHWCRGVPRVCVGAALRAPDRTHARSAQLGAGGLHSRRVSRHFGGVRAPAHVAGGSRRARRVRSREQPLRLPAGECRLLSTWRAGGVFGRWRRDQPRTLELGARSRLRHGRARRLYPRRHRRRQGPPDAHGIHLRVGRRIDAALARLVANRSRRSMGRVLCWRDSRHGPARASSTFAFFRAGRISRASASARHWRRAPGRRRAPCSAA